MIDEMRTIWVLFAVALAANAADFGPEARFEVASVKPALAGGANPGGGPGSKSPDRIRYGYMPLRGLIMNAWGVDTDQIQGPPWLDSAPFSLEAIVPPGITKEQAAIMLQNLLKDRFHLALHTEMKTFPTWEFMVAKDGPKLKSSSGGNTPSDDPDLKARPISVADTAGFPIPPVGSTYASKPSNGATRVTGRDITIPVLADMLGYELAAALREPPFTKTRIVDHTGLTGAFDLHLEFRGRPDDPRSDAPDLIPALEKQLGLRLQKLPATPIQVLVIDHADKTPEQN